jgi:probable HAF family extracellular repeat protein
VVHTRLVPCSVIAPNTRSICLDFERRFGYKIAVEQNPPGPQSAFPAPSVPKARSGWGQLGYHLIIVVGLIQCALGAGAPTPTTLPLANGDFETGPFGPLGAVVGWTVGGNGKIFASMQGATSGTHSASLSAGGNSQNNILSQSFVTIPGRIYSLDFDTGVFGINFDAPMQLKIEVFGNAGSINQTVAPPYAGTNNVDRVNFVHYHYTFTADSGVTTLRFTDISASNAGADIEIDSVSVALHVTTGPGTYSAKDLGAEACVGHAINMYGQIAGEVGDHAFVTAPNGGSITVLGTLGGARSTATSINWFGQVAGNSPTANGHTHAFVSGPNGAGLTDLGSFDPGGALDISFGMAINDSGQVVGDSVYSDGRQHGFLSAPSSGPITDIGTINNDAESIASGVNASGQICGYGTVDGNNQHAFLSGPNAGPLEDLGTFGGPRSYATAVNATGQVVGYALISEVKAHSFLSGPNGKDLIDISVNNDNTTVPNGINSCGQVVGSESAAGHAFIYNSTGGITDLTALISPQIDWVIVEANGINDQGQIVAVGMRYTGNGGQHTFLLTPNLGLERTDSNTVTLFWPGSCAGPAVQETTVLGAAANWQQVTTTPTVVDGTHSFTRSTSADSSAHFYRLSFVTGP